jgi:citrate lyase synthetase
MPIITINEGNIDNEHICCAIGNDKENKARAETKKTWLKKQFENGLVFKRLDERGKVFIEYMPIENAWKPIIGKNYYVINCLWVSGQFKGKGYSIQLLNECIKDAKKLKKDGIVVVTSEKAKPFLTDKKFFLKCGFESVDKAPPYFELLVLRFKKDGINPSFSDRVKIGTCDNKSGFTFIYSNQCPFMEEYVELLSNTAREKDITSKTIKLKDYKEAQAMGSPFGTLGIYYKGQFVTHELMAKEKFLKLIEEKFV